MPSRTGEAITLALCGEANQARSLIDELTKLYPEDTIINSIWLPAIRAAVELQRGISGNAAVQPIDELQAVMRYEAAAEFWPQYLCFSADGKWALASVLPLGRAAQLVCQDEVIQFAGGPSVRPFDSTLKGASPIEFRWTPDGKAITYVVTDSGVSNIWSQPLSGDPPRRLTDFKSDRIFFFD